MGGAVLRDGRIAVLNAGNRELLFYGADGAYQNAIGRAGRGPGEFLDPAWLGYDDERDALVVWDPALRRLSTFDGTGRLAASHQVAPNAGVGAPPAISGRFSDGSFLTSPGSLMFFPRGPGVVSLSEAYGRYVPGTGRIHHLADGRSQFAASGTSGWHDLPFGKSTVVATHGAALLVGDTGTPAIRSYDLDGKLQRVIEWVSPPIRTTATDRAEYIRNDAAESPHNPLPADAAFADERPRFDRISVDRAGWIWVRMFAGEWEAPAPWLVFDANGVLQCQVDVPGRVSVLDIGEAYLLGGEREETGELRLVRFGLDRVANRAATR